MMTTRTETRVLTFTDVVQGRRQKHNGTSRCSGCLCLVLTEDIEAHAAWHSTILLAPQSLAPSQGDQA